MRDIPDYWVARPDQALFPDALVCRSQTSENCDVGVITVGRVAFFYLPCCTEIIDVGGNEVEVSRTATPRVLVQQALSPSPRFTTSRCQCLDPMRFQR